MTRLPIDPARFAGLDGLRAIAVGLVLVYHLAPSGVLPSGFIGVDVFFAISGFLITSLLIREKASTGRLDRAMFWRRRARRLLPALGLVLIVTVNLAAVVNPSLLYRVWEQVLGAGTFSYNWIAIGAQTGYFGATEPELFRNMWSLAVEEQFYLFWPLLLPLVLLIARARVAVTVVLGAAVASAVAMAVIMLFGGSSNRVYFGTDTHLFGIFLGAALALVFAARPASAPAVHPVGTRAARTAELVGVGAMLAILAVACVPAVDGLLVFPGVLAVASVLAVLAIGASIWPGSRFGGWLDSQPLRWVGERSYGIYLWHWPLAMLWARQDDAPAAESVWRSVLLAALTLLIAGLSYYFVEQPIRRLGFRGAIRRFGQGFQRTPRARFGWIVASVTAFCLVSGGVAAVAFAPSESEAMQFVHAGERALANAKATSAPASSDASAQAPTAGPTTAPTTPPRSATSGSASNPVTVTGADVTAFGDSVMLAAAPALASALPEISIDAVVSRSMGHAPELVQAALAAGQLRDCLVIALGTNGPVDHDALARVFALVGPDRDIVLVNAFANRPWIPGVNADLAAIARSRPRTYVADWASAIAPHTDLLAGDGIHPGPTGGKLYAQVLTQVLNEVARDRVERQVFANRIAKLWQRQVIRHSQRLVDPPR
ncbi:MAG TPA: acyltransferase family protein [Candidatus Lumbricidophila sp.]|nr:acyltransferase family protein [Candidatus Lumbricidophila sp.]